MRYKPQLVSVGSTTYNDATTTKTVSVTVKNGDTIIAFSILEGQATSSSDTLTTSGGSLSWSTAVKTNVANFTLVWEQHATATSDTTFNVSTTHAGNTSLWWGMTAFVFRGSDGVGTPVSTTNAGPAAPSLAVTTGASTSTVIAFSGDWNAGDGTSRVWLTINGTTPTAGNGLEVLYFRDVSHYAAYGAYWDNAGAAGTVTTGQSAITTQKYSIVAIEVKGTNLIRPVVINDAVKRAAYI